VSDAPEPASVDGLLAEARSHLRRVTPAEANERRELGALLVDTRPAAQRAEEGEIPGALVIERNVLEWRLDPTGAHHIAEVTKHDTDIIVFCSEGYASSLAAASLQQLGLVNATDLDGGFQAWKAAGLPVV
jgi:rhodanese-related sulfurtransferase